MSEKNGATLFASGNGAEHYSVGLFAIGPFSNGDSVFFDIFNRVHYRCSIANIAKTQ